MADYSSVLFVCFQPHKRIQSPKSVDTRHRAYDYIIICHMPCNTVDAPLGDCILTGRVQKPEINQEKQLLKFRLY